MKNYLTAGVPILLIIIGAGIFVWQRYINQTKTANSVTASGIQGALRLGPICPVERIPPDPQCAPKPYETSIGIYEGGILVGFTKTDSKGGFKIDIPPGTYKLDPAGGNPFPICKSEIVTVPQNGYVIANLSCDTGIR